MRIKPWIVRLKITDHRYRIVARFYTESDADGFRNAISKQLERNDYEVVYDLSNVAIGSLIQLTLVIAATVPLISCTRSDMNSIGRAFSLKGQPANASRSTAIPDDSIPVYGREGTITADEAIVLRNLNFERGQNYQSIKDRLGLPARRDWDNGTDYYRIDGSNGWVAIDYDEHGRTYGFNAARGEGSNVTE